MNNVFRWSGLSLLVALIVTGCSSKSDPALETTPAKAAPATSVAPAATQAKPAAPSPDLANPKVTTAQQPTAFAPPFPDRLEIFEPPKRAQTSVKRDDEHGQSVELKGFINVDQPRVVLSIDGVISPVPEGGEKYGVHVISIQPPSVVLQRGRNRWTATLE
jgi:hypothetical protein